ncbi:TPA: helix-turn-helix transcriptional regulator [Listeria monocytogenes]|uniref:Helix-turn-helix domain-containing protein n=1 Tax=Listeria monocytogenes TaxID=1639 RepID=A0A3T1NH73_LISMN|nr:helix-turn-helix transcriptional regulator [Listeria monocytogenes]MDA82874.1 XRE family transcriptional regulator [Listeria monocytogenes serotype 1/2b]ATL51771.1 XRE family transcriptional regulator [Listeria monocytogenes]ATL54798.1 XRE family transcriptional regulator [Listeria monocytogenes]AUF87748.1 XRE family transcriptional regulator [Listeria monocytogenes]AUH61441.1 XRE family transcriptional regulator [Listeria monocytogenes]
MSISYNKLWKLLIDLNMNKTQLREISGVSPNVIAKIGKNELVAMESLLKIAAALNVDVSEIISSDVIDAEDVK